MQLKKYWQHYLASGIVALLLGACGSVPKAPVTGAVKEAPRPVLPAAGSGRGGYYKDDGPADNTPDNLIATPDAVPKVEPLASGPSRPYEVFGQTYKPITDGKPFVQRGLGTWYGKKFHGQKTASGERYDMFKMTAAHPTLPIPSYARVTNLANGAQIIVRINDRGPFHSTRIIDLSYTAALKLGYISNGSGMLEVERLLPDEIARINSGKSAKGKPAPVNVAPERKPEPLPEPLQAAASVVALPVPADDPSVMSPIVASADLATADKVAPSSGAAGTAGTSAAAGTAGSTAAVRAGGIYLQFGAFSQMANAEAARERLLPSWLKSQPPLEVAQSGALYRLTSGPFASRQEAEAVARQVSAGSGVTPMILLR